MEKLFKTLDEQLEILNVLNNLRVNDKDKLQLKNGYIIFE